jgi:O-antigen ligase
MRFGSGRNAFAADIRVRCLQALAIGVTLLVAPKLMSSAVDLPKRLAAEGLVLAGWAALVLEGLAGGTLRFRFSPLYPPTLCLLAGMAVSALLSANPSLGFNGAGLVFTGAAAAILVVSGLDRGKLDHVVSALLVAGSIEGLYGLLQYAGIDFLPWASSWGSRCFGTIGNPVFFAEFIAPVLVLTTALLAAERDEERKDLLALLATVLFLALLISQTRSSWLGSLAGLAVAGSSLMALAPGGREMMKASRNWLAVLCALGLIVVLTASSTTIFGKNAVPVRNRITDALNFKGWSVRHRLILWRTAAMELRDRPMFGNGPDMFGAYFPLKQAVFREALALKGVSFAPKEQKSHNDYLQTAAETGIAGLGLFVWLLAAVARLGLSAVRRAPSTDDAALAAGMLGACTAVAVDACFNFPFRIVPVAVVFWIFAGSLALMAGARERVIPFPRDVGAAIVVLALALWVFASAVPRLKADRSFAEGESYSGANMWEMAVSAMEESLQRRPYDAAIHYQVGYALDRASVFDWTGRTWDRALRHYRRAQSLGLNDELLYGQMSLLFEKKGKLDRAIEEGAKAVLIYPESGDHVANLAYWYSVREKNLDAALKLSARAVASFPKHPLYLWMHGLVLEKLKRYREAEADLRTALSNLGLIKNGAAQAPELMRDIARLKRKAGGGI